MPSLLLKRLVARLVALFVAAFATQFSYCFAQTNAKPAHAASQQVKPETPHLEFVTEYIRELATTEQIREAGEAENKQDTEDGKLPFAGLIHISTMFQLELGSQIKMLRAMRLNEPFDDLIPSITKVYERKIEIWRRMGEIGSEFIGGPKEGVDYNKLAAEMLKLRGELEFLDKALTKVHLSLPRMVDEAQELSSGAVP